MGTLVNYTLTGKRNKTWNKFMWIAKILKFFAAPGQPGPNPVLSAGEHSFPFEFRIPEENLPSTYEGKHGHVKYWLKAILDRPWKEDKTVVEAFTVTEKVDVNQPEFRVRL